MKKKLVELLDLPYSTGECDIGPEIRFRPGHASVAYDTEGLSETIWTELRFSNAEALRIIPDEAVVESSLDAYSTLCELHPSPWVAQLNTEAEEHKLPDTLRHFVIYFDHHCSVEILATDYECHSPSFPPSRHEDRLGKGDT